MNTLGWGFGLWLFGYILGMVFFPFVPSAWLGWVISPIGTAATLFILWRRVHLQKIPEYAMLAIGWTVIAIICDYLFIVQLLKPADGYYKPDVFVYYGLTFILPLAVGWWKVSRFQK